MGTLMACPVPDRLDRRFREALVIARSWRISDGELTLLDADGTVLARFDPRLER
jgi:heat shock protein HslJ